MVNWQSVERALGSLPKLMATNLPSLDLMRTVLRIGMTHEELMAACDALLETHTLRVGSPILNDKLISIGVAEGDVLLCFLPEGVLTYVEYKGDIFME